MGHSKLRGKGLQGMARLRSIRRTVKMLRRDVVDSRHSGGNSTTRQNGMRLQRRPTAARQIPISIGGILGLLREQDERAKKHQTLRD